MSFSTSLKPSDVNVLVKALESEWQTRQSHRQLTNYTPYPKQKEFHAAGKLSRQRLLMAANQVGKTLAAGMECAMHATGIYPEWWEGRRFERAVIGWAAGVTGESTRDNPQRILLGRPGAVGTGAIPKQQLVDTSSSRGLADAVDTIRIQHVGGGISQIALKSYEKGREKWQGETLDFVWFDEEPPQAIYSEGLTRTNATGGMTLITFTPLLGMTEVVRRFLLDKPQDAHVTIMTIDDAEHYSVEQRAQITSAYAPYERDARTRGVPQLGSGRVFPVGQDEISCAPFEIPSYWPQLGGLDFGWDHPSAGVRMAWDRDNDVLYVTATHRAREQTPVLFAASVKPWGAWLPWAWPHDGLQHDKGSGEQLAKQYRDQGLNMMKVRSTFPDGSSGLEAGISEMLERMQTGRLKIFAHLSDWFEEFNLYHRKDGLIVKLADDLMSATRCAMMMRRNAIVQYKGIHQPLELIPMPAPRNDGLGWLA